MLPGARSVRPSPANPKEMLVEIDVAVGPFTAVFTGQVRPAESDPPRKPLPRNPLPCKQTSGPRPPHLRPPHLRHLRSKAARRHGKD